MGNGGPRIKKIILPYRFSSIFGGFQPKMENFAQISVMKQNSDYNLWKMKILFCYFLNYISHCVYLLYIAIKQAVFVVCTIKWQQYFII